MLLLYERWKISPIGKRGSRAISLDFQDSPDDEEDTRSSQEYMNDLEEEYQARALLAKYKRFLKKGTQRFSSAKATDQTKYHKCSKKGHFARDCWSNTLVPSYQSPFQPKLLHSSEHKLELRHTKDFEAKYNKVKAKLALLNSSTSAPSLSSGKNKGLITESYDWDEEEVSSDKNEVTKVKALMALADKERIYVGQESTRNGEWTKISIKKLLVLKQAKLDLLTIQHVNTEILKENQDLRNELKEITSMTETWLNSSNKFCDNIPDIRNLKLKKNTSDPSIAVTESSTTNYDSADESLVYNTQLLPLKKLDGAKLVSEPKIVKSVLKSKSTFKAKTLKGIKINEPSSARARGNKSSLASKTNSSPAQTELLNRIISLRRGIKPKNPQHIIKNYETCGINVHTTSNHNDIEWPRKRGAPQAKKAESFKANKTESPSALRSKTPTKSYDRQHSVYLQNSNKCNLVQIRVDNIIPESTSTKIKQSERGISINKERYVNDLLQMYDKIGSSVNTPIMAPNMLEPDLKGITINEPQFKSMIGSQTSQASSRPDIQFLTDLSERHQQT
ncbi:hypothetical protein Tco_1003299 [Tanacetum coccineum]|uniref:CCHC-type domain-containing protein n=1 Tax=Tanacetum coccineum TaxID=301880 RepID=A0ABQ5F8P0_9ASTR